ncbi:MAG TPA: fused MFS/spermidine synthase [Gaiellaceae bacterium]|nr:fused MFS/spermidine synthase [Gaiellaceae bacterium]
MGRDLRSSIAVGVAVFIAGGALLGLEIASSRVLAPFFGNSLYVWGALIGIVLAGLSTGYWLGGIVADRYPTPRLLVGLLGTGALLVLSIPFIDGWVLDQVVAWDPGPRLNPLLATILLFGVPSVVLGTVSPVAVRLKARSLANLGRTAGRLFAISTAGSIAGTFLTSFWLIPALGTDQVLASAAVALMLAAAAVAVVERLAVAFAVTLALAGASLGAVVSLAPESGQTVAASQLRNWSPVYRQQSAQDAVGGIEDDQTGYKVVHTEDSQYHRIAVVEDGDSRYLRFDSSFQSGMYLGDPYRTRFGYSDYLTLPWAYRAETKRILYIGLGGGSAPKRTWRDFPGVRIDVVELDPAVVDAAYTYFELPRDPRVTVEVEDGRRFIAQNEGPWDVIAVDAFYSDSIPFHLATREFLELARSRLAPGGLVVTNIIGAVRGPDSRLFRSMLRTYRAVFPTVAIHPVTDAGGNDLNAIRNIILVSGEGAAPSKEFLLERWAEVERSSPAAPDLTDAIRGRVDSPVSTEDVPVLTDDYAPTDALLLLFD